MRPNKQPALWMLWIGVIWIRIAPGSLTVGQECEAFRAIPPRQMSGSHCSCQVAKYTMPALLDATRRIGGCSHSPSCPGLETVTVMQVAMGQQETGQATLRPALSKHVIYYMLKHRKRYIADFLLHAIIYILGILHRHYMTSNIIYDVPLT